MLWAYSPGHSRKGAAAGPVAARVEEGDTPRTAVPAPEDSSGTVRGHFAPGLGQTDTSNETDVCSTEST